MGSGFETSLIAVLEKSVFYYCDEYLTTPTVSLGLPKQFVMLSARAFMSASLVVIPYIILEIYIKYAE